MAEQNRFLQFVELGHAGSTFYAHVQVTRCLDTMELCRCKMHPGGRIRIRVLQFLNKGKQPDVGHFISRNLLPKLNDLLNHNGYICDDCFHSPPFQTRS